THGSSLLTDYGLSLANLAGFLDALDRQTGKEKWKVDTRARDFPDAHPLNGTFASPILADGKIGFAGCAFEQWYAHNPSYKSCTGRGYVVALEPETGKIVWKYDVGPKPEKLAPPVVVDGGWGKHTFESGPATSSVWSTPTYDPESNTLFFGTDVNTAPRQPTKDDPN